MVRTIDAATHLRFIEQQRSVSFLQTPAWAAVKNEWRGESIGWFDGEQVVGAGLVLYRQLPGLNRMGLKRYLAYLPEGPVIDWTDPDLDRWLDPMTTHLKKAGAFGIRLGPVGVGRRWHAATIKAAVADPALHTLSETPADEIHESVLGIAAALQQRGWREIGLDGGFAAGQPKYNFQVPLGGRSEDDVLTGMNQLWRRNIKKAAKAGVEVTRGSRADLPDFHRVYAETAERDGFTPRPLAYFERMWDALTAEDPQRFTLYLAQHEGDLVAETTFEVEEPDETEAGTSLGEDVGTQIGEETDEGEATK